MSEPVLILTTIGAATDAPSLARVLVGERLAACVNVLPEMQSIYRWQGDVTVEGERQLLIKTTADRVEQLQERLHALHPYEVPEFLVMAVQGGSAAYLQWLTQSAHE